MRRRGAMDRPTIGGIHIAGPRHETSRSNLGSLGLCGGEGFGFCCLESELFGHLYFGRRVSMAQLFWRSLQLVLSSLESAEGC